MSTSASRFHALSVVHVEPETDGAVCVTLHVPEDLRTAFAFTPGQFLTLRATIDGHDVRRSYSICSTPSLLQSQGVLQVGIRAVEGGVFSNWACSQLKSGDSLQVMQSTKGRSSAGTNPRYAVAVRAICPLPVGTLHFVGTGHPGRSDGFPRGPVATT